MIEKIGPPLFLVACVYFICTGCNSPAPRKYFEVSVLNCNMVSGFSGEGVFSELQSPPGRLVKGSNNQIEPVKRKEVIDNRIQFLEENLKQLKGLPLTPDTKDMVQTYIALHEYVLPVFKNEYQQLAK